MRHKVGFGGARRVRLIGEAISKRRIPKKA
jgi:hypothetical protein